MNKQFNRPRRHNNNRSRSVAMQQITRFTILDSSGPLGKLRGTALQLAEKYQTGAKDAQTQGDDVLFQTCQQYADHYLRMQAIAIENEQLRAKPEVVEVVPEHQASGDAETDEPVVENVDTASVVDEKKPVMKHKKKAEETVSESTDMPTVS